MSDEAKTELHLALCYFKIKNSEDQFLNDLIKQLRLICSMPEAFQIRYRDVRIVSLSKFNYSIHYRVRANGSLVVYRILNQKQDF